MSEINPTSSNKRQISLQTTLQFQHDPSSKALKLTESKISPVLDKLKTNQCFKYNDKCEFSWLRFDKTQNKMYCTLCENYNNVNKFMSNNMIRGSQNFQKCTLREHILIADHIAALDLRNKTQEKQPEKKSSIPSIFKSIREQLQFLDMLPLIKNAYWVAKENLSLYKFESLNTLNEFNGLEFNQNYRNRKAGLEIMTHCAEIIRD